MKLSHCQVWCFFFFASNFLGSATSDTVVASAPATPDGVCGDESYKVTFCLPGTPQNATCTYIIQSGIGAQDGLAQTEQVTCPQSPLFQLPCTKMPGTMTIAFGRCNSNDPVVEQRSDNTLDVAAWVDVMGLRKVEELGSLVVRGYAYQQTYSLFGVNLFPGLRKLTSQQLLPGEAPLMAQISLSGLSVPPLPQLASITAGLSILNSPDADFTDPPRFPLLTEVDNGISIAGCNSLKSLAGLEKLQGGNTIGNVQIINNLILSNMSALSGMFQCMPDGGTGLDPSLVIGIIAAHPIPLQPINHGCTLNNPGTLCEYIADSTQCPNGTEYVRNSDGTIQRIYRSSSPAPAPSLTPALSPAALTSP